MASDEDSSSRASISRPSFSLRRQHNRTPPTLPSAEYGSSWMRFVPSERASMYQPAKTCGVPTPNSPYRSSSATGQGDQTFRSMRPDSFAAELQRTHTGRLERVMCERVRANDRLERNSRRRRRSSPSTQPGCHARHALPRTPNPPFPRQWILWPVPPALGLYAEPNGLGQGINNFVGNHSRHLSRSSRRAPWQSPSCWKLCVSSYEPFDKSRGLPVAADDVSTPNRNVCFAEIHIAQ